MDATLKAGLQGAAPTTFTAVRFDLPGDPVVTVRLCSGGIVAFDSQTFASVDATWGTLDRVEIISDGVETSRTTARLAFLIPNADALASILNLSAQGAPIKVWQGAINRATGAALGNTAELLFEGVIDGGTLLIDQDTRQAIITCTTRSEYQQHAGEEWRLSGAFHKEIWPGELGLDFYNRPDRVFWRTASPRGVIGYGGGGIGSGGDFGLTDSTMRIF